MLKKSLDFSIGFGSFFCDLGGFFNLEVWERMSFRISSQKGVLRWLAEISMLFPEMMDGQFVARVTKGIHPITIPSVTRLTLLVKSLEIKRAKSLSIDPMGGSATGDSYGNDPAPPIDQKY